MIYWIGFDVGKEWVDYAIPRKQDMNTFFSGRFNNDQKGFEVFLRKLTQEYKDQDVRLVCECTGIYFFPLWEYFSQRSYYFAAVNPAIIKSFKRTLLAQHKTDKADARFISIYGQKMAPPDGSMKSPEVVTLKRLMNMRKMLLHEVGHCKNLRESVDFYRVEGSESVENALADLEQSRAEKIKKLEKTIDAYCKKTFPNYSLLLTVKGIGPQTACTLIAETDDFRKFRNVRQLQAYAGLSPRMYESGTSVYATPRIAPRGQCNPFVRSAMYQAGNVAIRHSPEGKRIAARLNGKPHKYIVTVIARKLLVVAWGVVRGGQAYDPKKHQDTAAP